ncbi:phosphatidylethanolamine-binding protein [Lasiosphaeria miniovina]|uniref:Phosphatidylethanolamine-binding protein n=1 Tax=Lasiosphaeria miniovina TaxID=1954250 RepID=A0AA40AB00_9PEZI|nr:phosphatidylethanolamine-binding protein [Lasiosphaeria miniovina]KAK0712559.1 phosphatidylethanolamine-binding protein [Lasiosphaeria miniovina]
MGKEGPSVAQVLAEAGTSPTLRILFPDTAVTRAGSSISKEAGAPAPTLAVAASALGSKPPATKYLAISLDLDAPFVSFAVLAPVLHGIDADLVAASPDGAWNAMPWVGPGPPSISGPHRYVFLLFAQPDGLDAAKVKSLLGINGTGLWPRVRWDEEAAEKKLGVGELLAGTFFTTKG